MGGNAFSLDGLSTPRMPDRVYQKALEGLERQLSPLFLEVTHAIDAPEKADHGDIDILAAPLPTGSPSPQEIARTIGAEKYYHATASNGVMHFAVPWPQKDTTSYSPVSNAEPAEWNASESVRALGQKVEAATIVQNDEDKYIQVDLKVCTSEADLHWRLFAEGHGDLVNIVCSTIRHKGLTLTSQALYVRIPDLDTPNPKIRRIELSKDPEQVMSYLGLDTSKFWQPFTTRDEMMSYISMCRFYDPARLKEETEEKRAELTKASLNPRDKHNLNMRPIFRYWYEQYLPAHENDEPRPCAHMTREEVQEDAFTFFGGDTRQRYERQKRDVSVMIAREKLWSAVRKEIAAKNPSMTESELHDTMRAIRREIVPSATAKATDSSLSGLQKAYLTNDLNTVKDWAVESHAAALSRWREMVQRSRMAPRVVDAQKANKYSASDLETFTLEDDATIIRMKEGQASWPDILAALGKTSKSQLQAHWKKNLQSQDGAKLG